MENKLLYILLGVAIVGVYFLGNAMTGWVISESCCFPPNCENLCEAAKPNVESPAPVSDYNQLSLGIILVIGALAVFIVAEYQKHHV